ncbi:MAG TPA: Bax inhibitor-1/YccA family protein [Bacillota bacterium]
MSSESLVLSRAEVQQRAFIAQVYAWMAFALVITGMVAWYVANSPHLILTVASNKTLFFGMLIGELVLVVILVGAVEKLSAFLATLVFFVYSMLNGFTLSILFLAYTMESITSTFLVTAGTFGAMSVYGFVTKRDLTSVGNLCGMALIGLLIASLVNLFFSNNMVYWISTYAGILIFVGLTAYDTQKIKQIQANNFSGEGEERKVSLLGALTLYLDFINLFIYLLRLLGRRK